MVRRQVGVLKLLLRTKLRVQQRPVLRAYKGGGWGSGELGLL